MLTSIKRILASLMMLIMLITALPAAHAAPFYQLGDRVADFTVTTWDGQTISLYDMLEEKDVVLINVWATWCGPCRQEIPAMQAAYEQYGDSVGIIAIDAESRDTDEAIAAFVRDTGMTFPAALDTAGIAYSFGVTAFPTNIIIDRFGTVCYIQAGAMPDEAMFLQLFDAFIGEDYTESVIYKSLPPKAPDVAPATAEQLAAALGDGSGTVRFDNISSRFVWPMLPAEKDGRSVLASTNAGQDNASSGVQASVTAKAGDAIAVTFSLSAEQLYDRAVITVNGQQVKAFTGVYDWMTYAVPVTENGEYTITVSYVKDSRDGGGSDTLWVDEIALLSGNEAAQAVAANPVWAAFDETAITVANADAREIIIEDPTGVLPATFGESRYFIVPGGTADMLVTLDAAADPECAVAVSNFDSRAHVLKQAYGDDGLAFTTGIDSYETTGYVCTLVSLYPDIHSGGPVSVVLIADEQNADMLVEALSLTTWSYADEAAALPALRGEEAVSDIMSQYVLTFTDQHGDPVPGVIAQVCDESICVIYTSDENGQCRFKLEGKVYDVHVLMPPAGYADEAKVTLQTAPAGGELAFTLVKQ